MDSPYYLVGAAIVGAVAGYTFGTKDADKRFRGGPTIAEKKKDPNTQMAFLVRTDLGMSKGKAAAQVSHAVLAVYEKAVNQNPLLVSQWRKDGQQKVVLGVGSESELFDMRQRAENAGLTTQYIQDAGRTQIDPGSVTVLAIGPATLQQIEKLTLSLKLF